ncbi:SPAG8 protein, partial [Alcedo cyanopectus]|nr:SPAG8 protein [Ceyx cyanopectus]
PEEQLSQQVPRGSCSIHNWQERATNHLDAVPGQEPGTEAFIDCHSHQGLLVHQLFSWPASSTAMKDRALLLGRGLMVPSPITGQREVMLESMLYQKYRQEMLEEICAQQMPMESVSITHHDYRAEDFQFMPLRTSQHNYFMEQPCSFWLEQAHILPGVTSIVNRNSPFRKNAAFSTPITEYLEQPLP